MIYMPVQFDWNTFDTTNESFEVFDTQDEAIARARELYKCDMAVYNVDTGRLLILGDMRK